MRIGGAVGVVQGIADRGSNVENQLDRELFSPLEARMQEFLEVGAIDVLHHQEVLALDDAMIEDPNDVPVIEALPQSTLFGEQCSEFFEVVVDRKNLLEGQPPGDAGVPLIDGEIDLGHAPAGEKSSQSVVAEGLAAHGWARFSPARAGQKPVVR